MKDATTNQTQRVTLPIGLLKVASDLGKKHRGQVLIAPIDAESVCVLGARYDLEVAMRYETQHALAKDFCIRADILGGVRIKKADLSKPVTISQSSLISGYAIFSEDIISTHVPNPEFKLGYWRTAIEVIEMYGVRVGGEVLLDFRSGTNSLTESFPKYCDTVKMPTGGRVLRIEKGALGNYKAADNSGNFVAVGAQSDFDLEETPPVWVKNLRL